MRRLLLCAVLAFSFAASASALDAAKVILPVRSITGAESVTGTVLMMPADPTTPRAVVCEAVFVYGSGGTTVKAWLQTSFDNGVTWVDIMNFAFTTATASKVSKTSLATVLGPAITPTDATLADNTIVDGLIGDRLRLKWVTTGTYAGGTTLKVSVIAR